MGITNGSTDMTMDYDRIEDWNMIIYGEVNRKLPIFAVKFIEDLIKHYQPIFDRYNDYDLDEYWYLSININTDENKMTFNSACKVEKTESFDFKYNINEFSEKGVTYVNELTDNGEDIIDMRFYGRWDDGGVTRLFVNGRITEFEMDKENLLWEIVNEIMIKVNGRYWNSETGSSGNIRLWDGDIIVDGVNYYEDLEDTELNLVVTPDNVER
jgi:hypothetical protein